MLIREYRVVMPLSVNEYRIAQQYAISKSSRKAQNSRGVSVHIKESKPYDNGPGGSGQFMEREYRLDDYIPGWLRALLPNGTLVVDELCWDAYPYCKSKFICPNMDRFEMETETYYLEDDGKKENVFNLSPEDLSKRVVKNVDFVNDEREGLSADEDPMKYHSVKTGRGPLSKDWESNMKTCMCAYKLCRVQFQFWGIQSRVENFIQFEMVYKAMLNTHRVAWCTQDEWAGMTVNDIKKVNETVKEEVQSYETDDSGIGNGRPTDSEESGSDDYFDDTSYLGIKGSFPDSPTTLVAGDAETASVKSSPSEKNVDQEMKSKVLALLFHFCAEMDRSEAEGNLARAINTASKRLFGSTKFGAQIVLMGIECNCAEALERLRSVSTKWQDTAMHQTHLALCAQQAAAYKAHLKQVTTQANLSYDQFVEKHGHEPKSVIIIADNIGSLFAYDMLQTAQKFCCDIFICLGSSLGLLLCQRQLQGNEIHVPQCKQVYNAFFAEDPFAFRLEPAIDGSFKSVPPCQLHELGSMQKSTGLWVERRIDYCLEAPKHIPNLPIKSLSILFVSCYMECPQVAKFVLTAVYGPSKLRHARSQTVPLSSILPAEPTTSTRQHIFLRSNYRADDVVVIEGDKSITLRAKFCCGPLGLGAVAHGEISVYGQQLDDTFGADGPEWTMYGRGMTDARGNFSFKMKNELGLGSYLFRLVPSQGKSDVCCNVFVISPRTGMVVFNVDASLTTSSTIRRDAKVQPGSLDVVSFWYTNHHLISYISRRHHSQRHHITEWLTENEFPPGLQICSLSSTSLSNKLLRRKSNGRWLGDLSRIGGSYCNDYKSGVWIHVGYGSADDAIFYKQLGLSPKNVYVTLKRDEGLRSIGSAVASLCQVIPHGGYAEHLKKLQQMSSP